MHIKTTTEIEKNYKKFSLVRRSEEIAFNMYSNYKWICALEIINNLEQILFSNLLNRHQKILSLRKYVYDLKKEVIK